MLTKGSDSAEVLSSLSPASYSYFAYSTIAAARVSDRWLLRQHQYETTAANEFSQPR
jgi:hypothetical protein